MILSSPYVVEPYLHFPDVSGLLVSGFRSCSLLIELLVPRFFLRSSVGPLELRVMLLRGPFECFGLLAASLRAVSSSSRVDLETCVDSVSVLEIMLLAVGFASLRYSEAALHVRRVLALSRSYVMRSDSGTSADIRLDGQLHKIVSEPSLDAVVSRLHLHRNRVFGYAALPIVFVSHR